MEAETEARSKLVREISRERRVIGLVGVNGPELRGSTTPRLLRLLLPACLLLLASEGGALAAEPAPQAWVAPRLENVPGLPERVSISGDFRLRYEYLDNQFRAGRPGEDQILALRTRVHAQFRFTDWLSIGAEFQDSRAYLADDNTPVGTGLVNAAELLRAYVEASFEGPFGGSHRVQFGRVTMDIGSRRLVARNRFRNSSNAFTGLDWIWQGRGGRELRAFYALPVKRLPDDRGRLVNNDLQFDDDSFDFQFWGLFYADRLPWGDSIELYAFGLYERESYDASDGSIIPRRRYGTPGFRLLRAPRAGRFDYEFETALQAGSSGSRLTEGRRLDHFAHFHHLELGYTFERAWSPRLLVHYNYASGDDDPFDGKSGRFDRLFGARRFDFGPTSIYAAFGLANINTPGIRLQLMPAEKWTAFVDYRAVWLASARDEWVPSGVRDPTGRSGNFVGQQVEMRVRWRPLPGSLLLEAGYAHLFAGEFIDQAPNANGGDTNYVYFQTTLHF